MLEPALLPFAIHPLRNALYDELHARPFHLVTTPQQITHLAFRAEPAEMDAAFGQLCDLCRRYSANQPAPGSGFFQQDLGQFTVRWERHMEFFSLTFLRSREADSAPFQHPVFELLPTDWLGTLPGEAVAAFHLYVAGAEAPLDEEALSRHFEGQHLIFSHPKEGKASLGTAFKLHGDGFGRFIIQNHGIDAGQMGRLVQRVIELETYRLLALLSLPIAKEIAPSLAEMDHQLAAMLAGIPGLEESEAERDLLQRLSTLAARLETCRTDTNYRFAATQAYHDLVRSRLENIRERKVEGYMTVAEFMNRRLTPGLRTCQSVQSRMEGLSRRIERAGELLRTRVNLTLQEQNKSLLASMDRRSRLQFRLQETVEGLSVAAISYYMVGLLSYVLSGLPLATLHLDKTTVLALLVPLVVALVWWLTKRIKHRLIKGPDTEKIPSARLSGRRSG